MSEAERSGLTHERLVWLAARDEVHVRSAGWLTRLFASHRGAVVPWGFSPFDQRFATGLHVNLSAERLSAREQLYAVICDQLASDFDSEERQGLRTEGVLPPWFWVRATDEFDRKWRTWKSVPSA